MNRILVGSAKTLVLMTIMISGCSLLTDKVVLDGAAAEQRGERLYVVASAPYQGIPGERVVVFQRVEQAAIDPTDKPWHPLKPVATGKVIEVTPQGAWVLIESGAVEAHGETQLQRKD